MLDMILIHFYSITDQKGWKPVYLEQLINLCSGGLNEFDELKDEKFIESEYYIGSYKSFDKEKWITEITASGYHKFSAIVPDNVKAMDWGKSMRSACVQDGNHNHWPPLLQRQNELEGVRDLTMRNGRHRRYAQAGGRCIRGNCSGFSLGRRPFEMDRYPGIIRGRYCRNKDCKQAKPEDLRYCATGILRGPAAWGRLIRSFS